MPATRAQLAAEIRKTNPQFKDASDIEIEAFVGAQDPRYREIFDRARGALGPTTGDYAANLPASVAGSKFDPKNLEDNSTTERLKESAYGSLPDVDRMVDALPTVGGAVGGIAGGIGGTVGGVGIGGIPGAVAGAGLGGSAGESLRQMIQRARGKEGPKDWSERAKDVGKEGALNAAYELVGGVGGKYVLKPVAKGVYRAGAYLPKALKREFPTVIEDAIRAGVPLTEKGAAKATGIVETHTADVDRMIQAAHEAGVEAPDLMKDVLQPTLKDVAPQARNQAALGRPQGVSDVAERGKNIRDWFRAKRVPPVPEPPPVRELTPGYEALLNQQQQLGHMASLVPSRLFEPSSHEVKTGLELGHRAMLVPRRLISGEPAAKEVVEQVAPKLFNNPNLIEQQALKKEAQSLANASYRAQERGALVNSVETATDEALAKHLQKGIESKVPDVIEANKAAQRGIGMSRLVEGTLESDPGIVPKMTMAGSLGSVLPLLFSGNVAGAAGALTTAGLTKAATSPAVLSRAAIGLDRVAAPAIQGNAYRAMAEMIRKQLEMEQQEQQNPANQ